MSGGSIIGNIIEYLLSYILEAMYGTRFWDYAYITGNLNGRICIKYSLFWGVLAILLIKFIKQGIDKLINKMPINKRKIINSVIVLLFMIDALATVWAVKTYQNRVVVEYYQLPYEEKTGIKEKVENTLFSNKIMLKTFPNLRYINKDGKEYYIKDIIKTDE